MATTKTKKFLEEYYSLGDVHAFNTFVKSLPKPTMAISLAESIFALAKVRKSHENLAEYVPESKSYNEIVATNRAYEDAQKKLKDLEYSKEVIIDEYHPSTIRLEKHSATRKYIIYDEERDDSYEEEATEFFYTENNGFETSIIKDLYTLLLPYERKEVYWNLGAYRETLDLIQQHLDSYDDARSELRIYQECHNRGWNPITFKQVNAL